MNNLLAFIGPSVIHEGFKTFNDSWDMQVPVETLDDFEYKLSDENSGLSNETAAIIMFYDLFNDDREQFANIAAFYAPYANVSILIPESESHMRETIMDYIQSAKEALLEDYPDYNLNVPVYFVTYENAESELIDNLIDYVNSPNVEDETKAHVAGLIPNYEYNSDNFNNYDSYDEKIYKTADDEIKDVIEEAKNKKGTVITFTSSKGGAGKSTTSLLTTGYISKASKKAYIEEARENNLNVCLVDLDVRDGQLWFLTKAVRPKTIIDLYSLGNPTVETINDVAYTDDRLDFDLIFAPKQPKFAKEIPPIYYAKLISQLKDIYDVIILDTSVNYLDDLLSKVAYKISDKIVFVSDMGISSIMGCTKWIQANVFNEENEENNIPGEKIAIVFNKALKNIGIEPHVLEKSAKGLPIISMIPSYPIMITHAANTGDVPSTLSSEYINKSVKRIVDYLLPDENLPQLPYNS